MQDLAPRTTRPKQEHPSTSAAAVIERERLDPARIAPGEHIDLLRRIMKGRGAVSPLAPGWRIDQFDSWSVGGLVLIHSGCGPARYERTAADTSCPGDEVVVLRLVLRGRLLVRMDERHFSAATTDNLQLINWSLPSVCCTTDYELITVYIPRRRLPATALMGRKVPALTWSRGEPGGALVETALRNIWAQLPALDAAGGEALAYAFTGLLDGLLRNHPTLLRAQYANHSRLAAMKALLQEHLRDPGLGVGLLCKRFACSRATAYRLFEEDGGVGAYIQRQRLHGCLAELVRGSWPGQTSLEHIAGAWHLGTVGQLRRLFEAEFAVTPEQVLAARGEDAAVSPRSAPQWRSATAIHGQIGECLNETQRQRWQGRFGDVTVNG